MYSCIIYLNSFLSTANLDPVASAKNFNENCKIFFCDVFDEIYIRRHEEHSGGACIGVDENGDLQKGIVTLMVVGVTRNISCVLSRLSSSCQIRTRDSFLISSNSNVRFHCNNRQGNATVLTLCCMSFIVGF